MNEIERRCDTCTFWSEDGFCERVALSARGQTQYRTVARIWPYGEAPAAGDDYGWYELNADQWGLRTEAGFWCAQWLRKDEEVTA